MFILLNPVSYFEEFLSILSKVHGDAIYLGTHPRFLSGRGLKIYVSSSWRLGNFKFLRDLIFFSIIESLSKFKNCFQQSLFLYVYAKFYCPYLEIFSLTAGSCNITSVEVSIQTPKNCLILFVSNSLKVSIFGQKLSESVSIVWFKCRNLCLLLFGSNSLKVSILFDTNSGKSVYYCLVITLWKFEYCLI